ncbi:MAG: carboxy terminal-processing peptidase [Bacteroidota bacterium]|nr:carboxy terminal-processing peptidase [Bacteroidota bacterium]
MKKNKIVKAFLISAVFGLLSFTIATLSIDRNQIILDIVMSGLNNAHYSPKTIDDNFSEKFFDYYLKRLDYSKKFLVQSDVNQLAAYKKEVDDEINNGTFKFFELSNELINRRIQEKETWYKEILSKPFDYTVDEEYETDGEKMKFAASDAQLKNEWTKYLKYQALYRLNEMMDDQEKIKAAKDTTAKVLPFDTLEASARKKVMKLTDDWFKRLKKINKKQRYADYVNSITAMYDPHTEFFPPVEKKKFDQSMSGQLEGIGARLQQKDDYIKITEIVVGSPSYKQGELKAGDLIMKVAQGDKEPVDIVGMDIDEAIELIKGKKGTEVRLTVKKTDGTIKVIPIVRDIIQLDETFAHSAILEAGKKKVGYIKLPSFYSDFTKNGARRCAIDVKKEVEKLKGESVDGIIIDVRDNGGGSLQEVVQMSGLFIPKGPIVQVKRKNGVTEELKDYDDSQVYNGPMVVMVNHNSASASEILAAALQDYNRAVVVGTQSFGKGTVQSFLDLDNYLLPQFDTIKPLGSVKVTMQKFYRINGGTTQLRGVIPDITLPDAYSQIETGEKELDNPMPWDEIAKAQYTSFTDINYSKLKKASDERVKKSKSFQLVEQEAKEIKAKKDDSKYNLKLEKYRAEVKELRAQNKKYDELKNEVKGFDAALLKMDLDAMQNDTTKLAREKNWIKAIKKDIYLHEASLVIGDMK